MGDVKPSVIEKVTSELCEPWLQQRVDAWGPTQADDSKQPSWTGSITAKIGSEFHYITCTGKAIDQPCAGAWSRKLRPAMTVAHHCIYGGWVFFDGKTVTDVKSSLHNADGRQSELKRLRRLWAQHVLSQGKHTQSDDPYSAGIWDQATVDQLINMFRNVTAETPSAGTNAVTTSQHRAKRLGAGSGGWSGVAENGVILKRDSGDRVLCCNQDRCDAEPGGMFHQGDIEVWMPWNGWCGLASSRDSRWRPGYHLEILLCHLTVIIDFALTRASHRDWDADWVLATKWAWVQTPPDVPRKFVAGIKSDAEVLLARERIRMENLTPKQYVPDDYSTKEQRYQSLQDRGGNYIALETVGERMDTPRGLVAGWGITLPNDIIDYERDVLSGETNNLIRSFTSDQQVADAAAWFLHAVCWSIKCDDNDLTDALIGSLAWYAVMWRYNVPKLAGYEARSIRDTKPGQPPEVADIVEVIQSGDSAGIAEYGTYGELYEHTRAMVQSLYDGCTCDEPTEGHIATELLMQAMDAGGNDDIEQRLMAAIVSLMNDANAGELRSECGMDLLRYESFVRFFDPDTGLVARLHYRNENLDQGNTITE